MERGSFRLHLSGPGRAEVYLAVGADAEIPWEAVQRLDGAGLLVVGAPLGVDLAPGRASRLVGPCAGVVAPAALCPPGAEGLPVLVGDAPSAGVLDAFVAEVLSQRDRVRAYAFFVGRLERDFAQARAAIRAAVEGGAGMACVWSDDERHSTNVDSVRARTMHLIEHAQLVVADLTLGPESPTQENPSRAHEIGTAIAYGRPLLLCSQEPRRHPYFMIGDMQMSFWADERELFEAVTRWVVANRATVGRRVFNHELDSPGVAKPELSFDPDRCFLGPGLRRGAGSASGPGWRRLAWR